jgi:hypothetical protein
MCFGAGVGPGVRVKRRWRCRGHRTLCAGGLGSAVARRGGVIGAERDAQVIWAVS